SSLDGARSYRDAADASVRILGGESAGEMYETRFGCPVSSKFRGGPFAGRGSNIHNKPGLPVNHTGEEFASEPNWSEKIDRERRADIVRIECMCRRELHRTSIIYENVDRVCTLAQGVHSGVDSLDSFQVCLQRIQAFAKPITKRRKLVSTAPYSDDHVAVCGKGFGKRAANTTGNACDEDSASHVYASSGCRLRV